MYTPSSMILSFLYFKTFLQNFPKVWHLLFFLFQARPVDPPGRPAPAQDMHVCACLSADRPGRPTVCRFALRFSGSTSGSTAFRNLCFFLEDGQPDRSTGAQRLLPGRRAADRTGRPPSLQKPNGSFLFCAILKSVFLICFCRLFLMFWRTFSGQINLK